jgi:hypothetical protein
LPLALPSEMVERLRGCLYYRVDGPYIVVENTCAESLLLEALEVHYYVTVRVGERPEEPVAARREIRERLSLNKRIAPGGSLEVYFGPVENIDTVYAIVSYAGGTYRVELKRRRVSESVGAEGKGSA